MDGVRRTDAPRTAPSALPTPREHFGFPPGRDGRLAAWEAIVGYLRKLEAASPRLRLLPLGTSLEGRPLVAVGIAEPDLLEGLPALAARQQGRLRPCPDPSAPQRADPGHTPPPAIVLQTCGVHAAEAAGPQGVPEFVHELISREDELARTIRARVLFLLVPAVDPDGLDRMRAWCEWGRGRVANGLPPPGLHRSYAGHDINRDWIMQTQVEIRAVVEGCHARFVPQVVLDMHEMWTHGPRLFLPPYARPADPAADPEVIRRAGELGLAMAGLLRAQGLAGVATGVLFDAFSPARAYVHYHGGVRILCEAAGTGLAANLSIPGSRLRPAGDFDPRLPSPRQPEPWPGGLWSSDDVIRYQRAASWACLETVAADPAAWDAFQAAVLARAADPTRRPGAYRIAARQGDPTATRELLRVLRHGGVTVLRQPGQERLVPRAQPAGTWADTLLQPQPYPSEAGDHVSADAVPYDVTAHTLPPLMGVRCEWIDGATARQGESQASPALPPGPHRRAPARRPPVWAATDSASYRRTFSALASGQAVWQIEAAPGLHGIPPDGAFIPAEGRALPPAWRAAARPCSAPRVGVYAGWKTSSDEGWLRYVLDRFQQPFALLRDGDIQRGDFGRCSHLVLPSSRGRDLMHGLPADRYPPPYAGGLGERGRRHLREFVSRGGRLLAVEGAAAWAQTALGLAAQDETARPDIRVFAPGAIVAIAPTPGPLGFGTGPRTWVMYRGGPAFRTADACVAARFTAEPVAAGLAEGVGRLAGTAAVAEVPLQAGSCVLYGFSPYFRAQTWGAFRWFFNALL